MAELGCTLARPGVPRRPHQGQEGAGDSGTPGPGQVVGGRWGCLPRVVNSFRLLPRNFVLPFQPPTHPLYGCDQSRPVPQPVASEASWLSPCTRKRVASRPRRMTGDFLPPLHLPGAALLLSSPPSFCTFSGHAEDPGPPARGPVPRGQPGLGRLCLWRSSESRSCLQPPPTAFTFCQTSSAAFLEPHPQTRQTH